MTPMPDIAAAQASAATDRAWVATRKGLFELQRERRIWRVARVSFIAEPVSMLLPPGADGRMLAALNLGHFGTKLHASADAGATWHEVATPVYPVQPAAATGVPWKLQQIWSLERSPAVAGETEHANGTGPGAAHRKATVWAGTIPGGLFESDDFGASWTLVDTLWNRPERAEWFGGGFDAPGIHSICPHPQRPQELLVGVSCGGVWITRDAGAQWDVHCKGMRADFMPPEQQDNANVQDPHRVVRCAAQPEVLWTQHHCGIWRSTDNAATWHEVKAPLSSFGFAVAVHPRDADTAWFVPAVKDEQRVPVGAALVVNRTQDGGKSFETLRAGLPQQQAYDLVYRHGLEVADDGRTLLMGSTTGHLWTSFDGGEQWDAVALNLPPIYAVRFG